MHYINFFFLNWAQVFSMPAGVILVCTSHIVGDCCWCSTRSCRDSVSERIEATEPDANLVPTRDGDDGERNWSLVVLIGNWKEKLLLLFLLLFLLKYVGDGEMTVWSFMYCNCVIILLKSLKHWLNDGACKSLTSVQIMIETTIG